jgi:cell division protein FtsQ
VRTPFEQRLRERTRARVKRRTVVVAAALAPPVLAVALAWSPVLDVDSVRVVGARRTSPEVVRTVSRLHRGDPMVTVDTDGAKARVSRLPTVKSVTVKRSWPSRVVITLVERVPVVAVARPGRYDLVDLDGTLVETVTTLPPNTPPLTYPGEPTRDVVVATVDLLRALPPELRRYVRDLTATAGGSLSFRFADGSEVVWGSGERAEEKVRALVLLVRQHAKRYDVRVPDRPAVTPR